MAQRVRFILDTHAISECVNGPLQVLLRTPELVIVNKPSGIVVHPGWADDDGGIVAQAAAELGQPVWPVHRLDRATSGALCLALSQGAARALSERWASSAVQKSYIAIVRGHPAAHQLVDHPIPNKPDGPRVPAQTTITLLGTWERYALVLAQPHTGRLHQIRRHLKHLSCPVIGDANYGKGEHNRFFRERFGLARLALHAIALRIPAPVSATERHFVHIPPDGTLADCLHAMALWDSLPTEASLRSL